MLAPRILAVCFFIICIIHNGTAQTETNTLINEPVDISPDFHNFTNTYFLADSLVSFDAATMTGMVKWQRNRYYRRYAFDNDLAALRPGPGLVFPQSEYAIDPVLPFSIEFVSPRSFRIRMSSGMMTHDEKDELML